MVFSKPEQHAAEEIIDKVANQISSNPRIADISFTTLHNMVSPKTSALITKLRQLSGQDYGIDRPAIEASSSDKLVVIDGQSYQLLGESMSIPPRLVPQKAYKSFLALNQALENELGHRLVIQSGYRSPAYQLFVFVFQLRENGWNMRKVLKNVALPGYSEHSNTKKQALDLRPESFIGPKEKYDFSRTPEYRWLLENAHQFCFSLSYPKKNKTGTRFEPWHWRYTQTD